jgi:hypothetical protein
MTALDTFTAQRPCDTLLGATLDDNHGELCFRLSRADVCSGAVKRTFGPANQSSTMCASMNIKPMSSNSWIFDPSLATAKHIRRGSIVFHSRQN